VRWPKTKDAWLAARAQRLCWLLLVCGSLLTALASCASASSTPVQVTATPCVPLTPIGGSSTCGNIVITTDRSVYAPQDAVQLTVTNQMVDYYHPVSVILTAAQGCPIARAQRLAGSVWEDVPLCRSSAAGGSTSQPGTRQITVAAGKSYTETITLAVGGGGGATAASPVPFPTGLYQLVVHYYLAVSTGTTSVTLDGGGFDAPSQPFRVCTAGTCS
jgi:hypothetical protein